MNLVVADFNENVVSSSVGEAELRNQHEAHAIQEIDRQIEEMVQSAMEHEHQMIQERDSLLHAAEQELEQQRQLDILIKREQEGMRNQIQRLEDANSEAQKEENVANLLEYLLKEMRTRNQAILENDPIQKEIEEEKRLTLELRRLRGLPPPNW